MSKESPNLHPMALTLAIGRWSDLTPSLASGESVQRLMGDSFAKQNLRVAGSGRSDCRHSRASCRKTFAVFTFAGGQPD